MVVMEETCVVARTLICQREDISEQEHLMVSVITCLNDYGVVNDRGELRGEGQADQFSSIGQNGS